MCVGPSFTALPSGKVFLEVPSEACTDKSKVGLLLGSRYGCRDAGVNSRSAKS